MYLISDKIKILKQLKSSFIRNDFVENNIDNILKKEKIELSKFYYLFPQKTKSLCYFFFENIEKQAQKKLKNIAKTEVSISKRVNYLLIEFMRLLDKENKTSIFFLNFLITKPFLLKKISLNYSNETWSLLKDKSADFNFYTKRFILSQVLINSLIHWRGSENLEQTLNFVNIQIMALGKFGYCKSRVKNIIRSLPKKEYLTYFDFLHKD